MGWRAAVFQPVGTPKWRGGTGHGEPHPNQYAAAWRPAEWGVHVGQISPELTNTNRSKNLANHCGDNQCGCNDEKERREEDEATSPLLTLVNLLYSFFFFFFFFFSCLVNLSMRCWSQCSALTFGDTGRSLSFNKERELFTELNF